MSRSNNKQTSSFLVPRINFKFFSILIIFLKFFQEIYALTKRLILQTKRRPSTLIAGIIQPLLWLILFGALFQNAPITLFSFSNSYRHFLFPGIMVFTAFTGALNAGLPLMFDREFGFFNRLLVAPLISQFSIVISSALFISSLSLLQTLTIMLAMIVTGNTINTKEFIFSLVIIFLLTCGLTMFSIGLSFILPGHIELLALIFVINLPLLFASTALVPFSFMPMWLQIMASMNPLSYAIESLRFLYSHHHWTLTTLVVETIWGNFSFLQIINLLLCFNVLLAIFVLYCIQAKIK
uniref:ABC transporter n=1 Tax=Bangiopsis subsimplex TaxID=139980 RepID=A0A1C9CCW6_9RHOD|nr:ABC-2 type transporter [Bangiopsis subsimplex]AOM66230.1 ABC-2 type transporter [Bangiopsis subsimplex]ARO90408.1 ABC transporter [Bangiopsis subsimplex]